MALIFGGLAASFCIGVWWASKHLDSEETPSAERTRSIFMATTDAGFLFEIASQAYGGSGYWLDEVPIGFVLLDPATGALTHIEKDGDEVTSASDGTLVSWTSEEDAGQLETEVVVRRPGATQTVKRRFSGCEPAVSMDGMILTCGEERLRTSDLAPAPDAGESNLWFSDGDFEALWADEGLIVARDTRTGREVSRAEFGSNEQGPAGVGGYTLVRPEDGGACEVRQWTLPSLQRKTIARRVCDDSWPDEGRALPSGMVALRWRDNLTARLWVLSRDGGVLDLSPSCDVGWPACAGTLCVATDCEGTLVAFRADELKRTEPPPELPRSWYALANAYEGQGAVVFHTEECANVLLWRPGAPAREIVLTDAGECPAVRSDAGR